MRSYLSFITLSATFGGLLFGYDTAVISGTVESLQRFFIDPAGLSETAANSRLGFLVSAALIGCIIGGLTGGWLSSAVGRKKALQLAGVLFLVSAIGSALPELFFKPIGQGDHHFLTHFVFYRILGGFGVGLASMLSPLYIAEVSPAEVRGRMVSWNQFAIILGMLLVYFVNYSIARKGGGEHWLHQSGWRWMFGSEAVPASLFLIASFFIPETPRFLVQKGKEEQAILVLYRINSKEKAVEILSEIRQSLKNTQSAGNLFSYGFVILLIGLAIALFQQLIGINVILYYAPVIFKNMGAETDASLLSTIYVGAINLTFTIAAIFLVDRIGRKPLLLLGALIMAAAMLSVGFIFYFGLKESVVDGAVVSYFSSPAAAKAAFIFILLFIAGFAVSWGPVAWVVLSELFPNRIRSRAMALATAVLWISNWLISWSFPILNNSSELVNRFHHGFAYWIYGLVGLLAAGFVYRFLPETRQQSLEQLENHWIKEAR